MKTILKFILPGFLCVFLFISANCQSKLRWYPFSSTSKVQTITGSIVIANKDSTIFFSPSISFDLFVKEKFSGQYKIGAIPGVGYGVKYNPYKWKNNYLIGIDVFAQANLSEELSSHSGFDYFNVDVLPVITILNWIGIGYGPRFKIGLDGVPNINTSLFSIGIRKSL